MNTIKKYLNTKEIEKLTDNSLLKKWKHKDAYNYAKKLIIHLGKPSGIMPGQIFWLNKDGFKEIYIKDESIPHEWPKKHKDFVYSVKKVKVPTEKQSLLPLASGSIIYDGLKEEVTARCGTLYANAVTVGFVEDLVKNKIDPKEVHEKYAEYITEGRLPSWYKNNLGE